MTSPKESLDLRASDALEPFVRASELFEPIGLGTEDQVVFSSAAGDFYRILGEDLIRAREAYHALQEKIERDNCNESREKRLEEALQRLLTAVAGMPPVFDNLVQATLNHAVQDAEDVLEE